MSAGAPIRPMDDAAIADAATLIRAGELVAFATETVYGLGADATNGQAVAKVYAAKGRPSFNPLISHVAKLTAVEAIARTDARALMLADRFWPGALTLVLPKSPDCPVAELTTAGLPSIAVRVPSAEPARRFLTACGVPVAAPSANRSGAMSPTRAEHVQASLPGPEDGGPALILDAGPCAVGLESTVVDLTTETATLLRPGGIAREDLEDVVGPLALAGSDDTAPKSPGMLSRHYAPTAPLRLNAMAPEPGESFLGFGPITVPGGLNLSPLSDTVEAAANLFEMLHRLDAAEPAGIAVAPIPDTGLGLAINDRLGRAAKR